MSHQVPQVATIKNQWLCQQVDVEFPTQESLKGKDLYKDWVRERSYISLNVGLAEFDAVDAFEPNDIYLVDFHRLTVMFSLLQAQRWPDKQHQELIVEFLTQIIYSEPCELYLGFREGEPVASAIVTDSGNELLVSDVYVKESRFESALRDITPSKTDLLSASTE